MYGSFKIRLMRFFPAKKLSFKFAALFLCVWLSGATCAIACGAATVAAGEAAAQAEAPSCHAGNHETQNAGDKDELAPFVSSKNTVPTLDCCAFLKITAERAQKIAQFDANVAAPVAPFKFAAPVFVARQTVSFQKFYQPIPLNRGSTYLRNCVFLI